MARGKGWKMGGGLREGPEPITAHGGGGSFGQRDCRLKICVSPLVQGLLTAEGHKMGPQKEGMAVKGAEDLR